MSQDHLSLFDNVMVSMSTKFSTRNRPFRPILVEKEYGQTDQRWSFDIPWEKKR